MRSDVSLSTFVRILERRLAKKSNKDSSLDNHDQDFMIDSTYGVPFAVISKDSTDDPVVEDENEPKQPSLLGRLPSRTEVITTADLLQPTSLVTSNDENKIYGFYYLV